MIYARAGGVEHSHPVLEDADPIPVEAADDGTAGIGSEVGGGDAWLERKGFTAEQISAISLAYRKLLRSKLNTTQALEAIKGGSVTPEVKVILDFIESSERGVIK